jgi:hypothetical protein
MPGGHLPRYAHQGVSGAEGPVGEVGRGRGSPRGFLACPDTPLSRTLEGTWTRQDGLIGRR